MWTANLQQVFTSNPQNKPYDSWVLFLRHGAGTPREEAIRSKHEKIDAILAEQNVNYTEITTRTGRGQAYDKFNFRNGKHPIFLVLNQPPLDYSKGDHLMVIEWGKWPDTDEMSDDLMALVNFFSDPTFRKKLARAKDAKAWKTIGTFLGKHGVSILKIGATIAAALA